MTNLEAKNNIKNICVFSSSRQTLNDCYYKAAYDMGFIMGRAGYNLVYGGGALGTMYQNALGVKASSGEVIGVIPEKLHNMDVGDGGCNKLIITKCMRTRKAKLDELSDAVIALSGGFGTLEELSEMIVQKQLGYTDKAIVILNTNGFYDELIQFFEKMINQEFACDTSREIYYIANSPEEAINYLKTYEPKYFNLKQIVG